MAPDTLFPPLARLLKIGANLEDAQDTRLQKSLLVLTSVMVISLAVFWVRRISPWANAGGDHPADLRDRFGAERAVLSFHSPVRVFPRQPVGADSAAAVLADARPGRVYPFWGGDRVGVFIPAGGADVLRGAQSPRWLFVYLALLTAGALLQPYLREGNALPRGVVTASFVLNIGAMSVIVFVLLHYFIPRRKRRTACCAPSESARKACCSTSCCAISPTA